MSWRLRAAVYAQRLGFRIGENKDGFYCWAGMSGMPRFPWSLRVAWRAWQAWWDFNQHEREYILALVRRYWRWLAALMLCSFVAGLLSGCMTVGYSTARDPNLVKKWEVTIVELAPQNIYNALGVSLVGPFASVEHRGQRITVVDDTGAKVTIVQPLSNRYELHAGQRAVYVVDRGQVWVQPLDYPLPPEFSK